MNRCLLNRLIKTKSWFDILEFFFGRVSTMKILKKVMNEERERRIEGKVRVS